MAAGKIRYKPMKKVYYCIDRCKRQVSKSGNRCRSCANKGSNNPMFGKSGYWVGKKRPDIAKRMRRKHREGAFGKGSNYKDGRWLKQYYCTCGNKISRRSAIRGTGLCKSCAQRIDGRRRWKDANYKNKQLKACMLGRSIKPNKPEKCVDNLLANILPNKYKYVGNGAIAIDGSNPDFINVDGQKKLIELYGNYFHANPKQYKSSDIVRCGMTAKHIWDQNAKRIEKFSKLGFSTLIIWEDEIINVGKLTQKIMEFHNG